MSSAESTLWDQVFMQRTSVDEVLNAIQDGIVVIDRQFHILHVNQTIQHWFEQDHPISGQRCYELFYNKVQPCDNCPAVQSFETGEPAANRQSLRTASGQLLVVDIQASPIRKPDHTVAFVVNNLRDVTRSAQQEWAQQEREELYRSLFEQHSSMMLFIDPLNGSIQDANQAACQFYGYTRDELIKKNIFDINLLDYQQLRKEMDAAIETHQSFFKFRHRLASGDVRDVEVFSGPIQIHGKRMLCSVIHDVTERRIQEQEREQLLQDLQEALTQVRTLEGYIPICSSCKKIRDDEGYWNRIEAYIEDHSNAQFSHGMCPDCAEKLYGDSEWFQQMRKAGKI